MRTVDLRSPRLASPSTATSAMGDVIVALIPALGMGIYFFGLRVLVLTAISIASCVAFEMGYQLLLRRAVTVRDLSAVLTGLLLALCLPVTAPYWAPVLGGFFAIVVVKQFYGGFGNNFMNPALAGRMLLSTFPALMTTWVGALQWVPIRGAVDAVSTATPMSYLHNEMLPPQSLRELVLGYHGGSIGEVSTLMLLLGGLYLCRKRVVRIAVPASFIGTVAVLTYLFPRGNDSLTWMLVQLCSGGLMLGAFFMATDCITSPITPRGQLFYGIGCGAVTVLLRYFGSYPDGVGWAILTMNCSVWIFDRAGMPRRFGEPHFAETRRFLQRLQADLSQIRVVMPKIFRKGEMPGEAYLDEVRNLGRMTLSLGAVISGVILMISLVYYGTELATEQQSMEAERELLRQVMPQATIVAEAPYRSDDAIAISAAYSETTLMGYCIEVQVAGFGGPMDMTVGVDVNGRVTGIVIMSHSEVRNMGTKALTEDYFGQFVGKSGTITTAGRNSVDTVSGATITSKAVMEGVNRALEIAANLGRDSEVDTMTMRCNLLRNITGEGML